MRPVYPVRIVGYVVGVGEPALRQKGVYGTGVGRGVGRAGRRSPRNKVRGRGPAHVERGRRHVEAEAHFIRQRRFGTPAPRTREQLHMVVVEAIGDRKSTRLN